MLTVESDVYCSCVHNRTLLWSGQTGSMTLFSDIYSPVHTFLLLYFPLSSCTYSPSFKVSNLLLIFFVIFISLLFILIISQICFFFSSSSLFFHFNNVSLIYFLSFYSLWIANVLMERQCMIIWEIFIIQLDAVGSWDTWSAVMYWFYKTGTESGLV